MLHCRHQNDSCRDENHFNVLFIVKGKVTKTSTMKRKESRSGIQLRSFSERLTATPKWLTDLIRVWPPVPIYIYVYIHCHSQSACPPSHILTKLLHGLTAAHRNIFIHNDFWILVLYIIRLANKDSMSITTNASQPETECNSQSEDILKTGNSSVQDCER